MIIIPCPNKADFIVPPEDQPGCVEQNCPHCHEKMWISKKKRLIMETSIANIYCYDCLMKKAFKNPNFFKDINGFKI